MNDKKLMSHVPEAAGGLSTVPDRERCQLEDQILPKELMTINEENMPPKKGRKWKINESELEDDAKPYRERARLLMHRKSQSLEIEERVAKIKQLRDKFAELEPDMEELEKLHQISTPINCPEDWIETIGPQIEKEVFDMSKCPTPLLTKPDGLSQLHNIKLYKEM